MTKDTIISENDLHFGMFLINMLWQNLKHEKYEHLPGFGIKWPHKALLVNYPPVLKLQGDSYLNSRLNPTVVFLYLYSRHFMLLFSACFSPGSIFLWSVGAFGRNEGGAISVSLKKWGAEGFGGGWRWSSFIQTARACCARMDLLGFHPPQGLSRVELAVIKTPSITALTASPGDPGPARPTGNFRPRRWKKGMEKENERGERWFITARHFFFRKRRRWWSGRGVKRRWNREAWSRNVRGTRRIVSAKLMKITVGLLGFEENVFFFKTANLFYAVSGKLYYNKILII